MTTELSRFVPPVECAPWCDYGDGHPDECHREDQQCWSTSDYLGLSADGSSDQSFNPQIGVMTTRRAGQPANVYIHLYDIQLPGPLPSPWNQLDRGLRLTADEAEKLAGWLTDAAKLVRSTPPPEG